MFIQTSVYDQSLYKVSKELQQNYHRCLRHKITSILYTDGCTDRQADSRLPLNTLVLLQYKKSNLNNHLIQTENNSVDITGLGDNADNKVFSFCHK